MEHSENALEKKYFEAIHLMHSWQDFSLDVSFSSEKGEMTSIVGPSGSGKSTILRLIAGLEEADEREKIYLGETDITHTPSGSRGIGLVSQSHSLFSHLRVEDNVGYGLVCRGISKKESRKMACELLEKVGLKGFEKRYPDTLSGGEAQRVALARTLIVKPKLILFDEPLSALDAPLRKKLANEIRHWQKEIGFTGIMVTHDIEEAKAISDRIILIRSGKKMWEGNANEFSESLMDFSQS